MRHQSQDPRRLRRLRSLWIAATYLLTAWFVLLLFLEEPGLRNPHARLPNMISGQAHRPFVTRVLFAGAVQTVSRLTPASVRGTVSNWAQGRRRVRALGWEPAFVYEYVIATGLWFLCLAGAAVLLRHLVRLFYDVPDFVADLAPIGGLLPLPLMFRYSSYVYDPLTIFLAALALIPLATRRRLRFYALFVLATFNKETSALMIAVFVLRERGLLQRRRLLAHVLAMASLWLAVRAALVYCFRDNPGTFLPIHIRHNMELPLRPLASLYFLVVLLGFWLLVRHGWARKPLLLRQGLFVTLGPLLAAAVVFGFADELRDYYEAFPFVFLLCVPSLVEIFAVAPEWRERDPSAGCTASSIARRG